MIRRVSVPFLLLLLLVAPLQAEDAKLSVGKDDTIRSVLAAQAGKRVTLKLESTDELTGIVRSVGDHTVHLGELSGREFFDAIVDIDKVVAVIVRVK